MIGGGARIKIATVGPYSKPPTIDNFGPSGLCFDGQGNMYITDSGDGLILEVIEKTVAYDSRQYAPGTVVAIAGERRPVPANKVAVPEGTYAGLDTPYSPEVFDGMVIVAEPPSNLIVVLQIGWRRTSE